VSLWDAASVAPSQVTPLLTIDHYALFYTGLILTATIACAVFAYGYFEGCDGHRDELYILLLVATLGSSVLVAASHFVSFFLGLELLSIALYGMISYLYQQPLPIEAGVKYLVLAAASSAFLLFGMALLYAALGTMEFSTLAAKLATGDFERWLVLPGLAFIVTGFGFKLALVPFHLWTPDVYQGAPAPVTAYIATVSKGAMFALLLRFFHSFGARELLPPVSLIFSIIAIASMFTGNILALMQTNVKRVLAYSSIAHLGYVLVAFQMSGPLGPQAVTFYLVAYFVTILGAFGVITVLSTGQREAADIEDYRGLFWRRPALAAVFTAMLLSLAGIPVTAGFLGKFYIIAAGASATSWALIVILVITSAIGLFYYLRIVVIMYAQPAEGRLPDAPLAPASSLTLGILTVLLVWFGVLPGALLDVIRKVLADIA
jgi:NADH-quinone oxidoreductase subunit N